MAVSAAAATVALSGLAFAAVTGTGPLAPPLGACTGSACPDAFPAPNNGDFAGRDASINVFVGGDYHVQGSAAEAEGKIVTLGDLTIAKSSGGVFNMAVVGVGSRVPPPNGTDFVTVGGNVDVAGGNRLLIGGTDSSGTAFGNLRHGGTLTGTINIVPTGTSVSDPSVASTFAPVRTTIEERSTCAAEAAATGTVTVTSSEATFTGDGTSALQVFNVTGNLGGSSAIGLTFTGIPAGATVLVNMVSADATINTYTGSGISGDPTTDLRAKLMWNFPVATSATITGGAQFQGSVLAGNPSGTMTLSTPGINGRAYLAGNLVQEGSGGYELHSYPFTGELPICTNATSTPTPTHTSTSTPTPTPTATTSTSTSAAPTPSTATPTTSALPVPSTRRPSASPARPAAHGDLADTGADDWTATAATLAALFCTGGSALRLARHRGRRS